MFKFLRSILILVLSIAGLIAVAIGLFFATTPRPTNIRSCIVAKMREVKLCPKDKSYARIGQISPYVRAAVISSEDTTFYQHEGIDWYELKQSFEKNWRLGHFARGGSTITQQLAKNVYLTEEKSLLRKLREAVIAIQLEKILSKDEILEKYLNVVEFGDKIYGVTAAAKYYFGKTPAELSPVNGAFLAFLLPSPKKYSVSFRKKELTPFARKEIKNILFRMTSFRKISEEQYQGALSEIANMWGSAPAMAGEEAGYSSDDDGDRDDDKDGDSNTSDPTAAAEARANSANPKSENIKPEDAKTKGFVGVPVADEENSSTPPHILPATEPATDGDAAEPPPENVKDR